MGLVNRLYKDARQFARGTKSKEDLLADIKKDSNIRAFLEKNPDKAETLDQIFEKIHEEYEPYLGNAAHKAHLAGKVAGYVADGTAFTGNVAGALGGKVGQLFLNLPDKYYGLMYGLKTRNYLDAANNLIRGTLSYIPGLTILDRGMNSIIGDRIKSTAQTKFEKQMGIYKSRFTRAYERAKGLYTGVKNRARNIFSPGYEPQPALSPA